jgi:hypothetical protein
VDVRVNVSIARLLDEGVLSTRERLIGRDGATHG